MYALSIEYIQTLFHIKTKLFDIALNFHLKINKNLSKHGLSFCEYYYAMFEINLNFYFLLINILET